MPLFGNSLLARVLGHRSSATLYRSSAGENSFAPVRTGLIAPRAAPVARSASPVVMAKLVPPGATLPRGLVIPAESVGRATSPGVAPPAPVIQPVDFSPELIAPQPGPSLSQPLPVQREPDAPAPAPAAPAAQVGAPAPEIIQQQSPAQPSSPAPIVQRSPAAQPARSVQPPTSAGPDQAKPVQAVPPPADLPSTTMADSDFSWIDDSEWNSLKSFMEGHQALQRQQKEIEEPLQRAPDKQEELATKERATAELLQRQELARKGKLPRASVSYISPESAGKPPAVADLQARAVPGPTTQPPSPPSSKRSSQPLPDRTTPAPVQPEAAQAPVQRTEQAQSTGYSSPAVQSPPPDKTTSAARQGDQRPLNEALASPLAEVQAVPSPEIAPSPEKKPSPEIDRPVIVQRTVSDEPAQEARLTPEIAPGAESSSSPAIQRKEQAVAPVSATTVPAIPETAAPEPPVTTTGREAASLPVQTQSLATIPATPGSVQPYLETTPARPALQPVREEGPLVPPVQRSLTEEATSQIAAPVQLEPRAEIVSTAQTESPAAKIEPGEPAAELKKVEPRGFRRIVEAARSLLRREDPALPQPVHGQGDPQPRSEPISPVAATTPVLQQEIAGPLPPQPEQAAGVASAEAALPRPEEAGSIQRTAAEPATSPQYEASAPDLNLPGAETTAPLPNQDQPLGPQSIFAAPDFGPVEAIRPEPIPAAPSSPQISRQEESQVSVQREVAPPATEATPEITTQQLQSPEALVTVDPQAPAPFVGDRAPELVPPRVQTTEPVVSVDVSPSTTAVDRTPAEPAVTPRQERVSVDKAEPVQRSSVDPEDAETLIQPFPLQAVFPVQELKQPKASTTPIISKPPSGPPVQRKPAGIDPVGEVVHSATKDVAPVKSTDSSIELITPRRPRPVLASKSEPGQPEIQAPAGPALDHTPSTETVPPSPPPLQNQTGAEPVKPGDFTLPPPTQTAPLQMQPATTPAPISPPQTSAPEPVESSATSPPAEPAKEPYLVPTAIGDLPSDLWQMLGETPPPKQAVQRTADRAPARPVRREPPQALVTEEFHPPDIQQARAPVTSARQPVDSDEGGQEEAAGEEGEGGGEIDVTELARQVYPEIRRRLQVDWERGRGRLS